MKKKKIVVGMLIMCLLCVNLLSTAVSAEVSQPTTHNVHDSYEFRNAVKDAKDGDIISVYGAIEINTSVQIGSDTKHLTIQRVDENSYIIFNYVNAEVTNTVFDGMGKKSSYSWITTNYEAIYTGCTFQNCGSSENLSSSGSVGGAVKVQSGLCVFNNCVFSDNYALSGGQGQENQEQIGTNSTAPNIKIDAKGVDCVIEYNESGGYSISVSSGQVATDASSTEKNLLSWFDVMQIALLAAIFICLISKPKKIGE